MKSLIKPFIGLGIIMFFVWLNSCEKAVTEYDSEALIIKSHEITAYAYAETDMQSYQNVMVPFKIYVKGGTPDRMKGDYRFKVASGSSLPEGMELDSLNGVIQSNGKQVKATKEAVTFDIEVTDGMRKTTSKFSFKSKEIKRGGKMAFPVLQFNSPETRLVLKKNNLFYAVSLTMLGGTPPYYFELCNGYSLPGDLSINPYNGVISGKISDLAPGSYTVRIQCTDANGRKAVSLGTSQNFEEFILIVR
jgi:hypothetical protein